MPLLCGLDPRKIPNLAMWPLGAAAGAAGEIPASSGGGVGWGACREGLGCARDLVGPELGVETASGGACGGAQWRRPLRPKFRCGEGEVVQ
jgi:hypothetical protein